MACTAPRHYPRGSDAAGAAVGLPWGTRRGTPGLVGGRCLWQHRARMRAFTTPVGLRTMSPDPRREAVMPSHILSSMQSGSMVLRGDTSLPWRPP